MSDPFNIKEIRRTLQDQLPGTRYAVRVRAMNEYGQYGDWSEAMEYVAQGTGSDGLVAPGAPAVYPQVDALFILMTYEFASDGISTYILEHSLDNATFAEIYRGAIPLYVHQVSPGTLHYYRYKVVDVYGNESGYSPSNSGSALASVISKPYATIVVASASSIAEGAENADFVCTGTNDEITLSAAFNAAGYTGKVVLLDGSFNLSGAIDANTDIAALEGQGFTFVGTDPSTGTVIQIGSDIEASDYPLIGAGSISNIGFNGGGYDLYTPGYLVRASYISDCAFTNFNWTQPNAVAINAQSIVSCHFSDINASSEFYPFLWGNLVSCDFDQCNNVVWLGDYSVVGCNFGRCGTVIRAFNYDNNRIIGNKFYDCDLPIDLYSSGNAVITGNTFVTFDTSSLPIIAIKDAGTGSAITDNKFIGCGIESRARGLISGNKFELDYTDRAVTFYANSDDSLFINNLVIHNSSASFVGVRPIRVEGSVTGVLIANNNITVYSGTGAISDAGVSTSLGAGNLINRVWTPSLTSTGDKNYVHDQPSGATTWTVTHNLGKRCSVTTINSSGTEIFGTLNYVSDNQVTVTFNISSSGKAYCN